MAKTQTRRSISVRGSTYERIRAWCEAHDVAMSEFVEARAAEFFAVADRQQASRRIAAKRPPPSSAERTEVLDTLAVKHAPPTTRAQDASARASRARRR